MLRLPFLRTLATMERRTASQGPRLLTLAQTAAELSAVTGGHLRLRQ